MEEENIDPEDDANGEFLILPFKILEYYMNLLLYKWLGSLVGVYLQFDGNG